MERVACKVHELAVPPSSCWRRACQGSRLYLLWGRNCWILWPAWTKLCRVRWLWGFSFEPGLGAHSGVLTQCTPGHSSFPGAAQCCGRATPVGPLMSDLSTFWCLSWQLLYQLIDTLCSALISNSQNPSESVLKNPQKEAKTPNQIKTNHPNKKLKTNPWWIKLFSHWVMYIAHRGYSSSLYSMFIGNRMMY